MIPCGTKSARKRNPSWATIAKRLDRKIEKHLVGPYAFSSAERFVPAPVVRAPAYADELQVDELPDAVRAALADVRRGVLLGSTPDVWRVGSRRRGRPGTDPRIVNGIRALVAQLGIAGAADLLLRARLDCTRGWISTPPTKSMLLRRRVVVRPADLLRARRDLLRWRLSQVVRAEKRRAD